MKAPVVHLIGWFEAGSSRVQVFIISIERSPNADRNFKFIHPVKFSMDSRLLFIQHAHTHKSFAFFRLLFSVNSDWQEFSESDLPQPSVHIAIER